jgi:hypothetical protein
MAIIKLNPRSNFRDELQRLTILFKQLKTLNKQSALWGWFGGKVHQSSLEDGDYITLAALAILHHRGFITKGGDNVPARPVLTKSLHAITAHKAEIGRILGRYVDQIMRGRNPSDEATLIDLAQIGRQIVQTMMGDPSHLAPVSQVTLQMRKESKSNTPLVDTGELKEGLEIRTSKTVKPSRHQRIV